jgi:group I intron endonuclease
MNSGVYKITNIINNKIYIGSSSNLHKRFISHKNSLLRDKHYNTHLQKAYNKYKLENFKFEVIEYCDNIIEKEQYYLDILKPEYNINPNAFTCKGRKLTQEHKDKIGKSNSNIKRSDELKKRWSLIKKNNPNIEHYNKILKLAREVNCIKVKQYDLSMNFIKEYNSITEAAINVKGDPSAITKVCKGKLNKHKNFIFRY